MNPNPETIDPNLETQNPNPGTRNLNLETRNPTPETRKPHPKASMSCYTERGEMGIGFSARECRGYVGWSYGHRNRFLGNYPAFLRPDTHARPNARGGKGYRVQGLGLGNAVADLMDIRTNSCLMSEELTQLPGPDVGWS